MVHRAHGRGLGLGKLMEGKMNLIDLLARLENAKPMVEENLTGRGPDQRGYFIHEDEMLHVKRHLRALAQKEGKRL